jgi:hypothetical protein
MNFHASRYAVGVQTTVSRVTVDDELICRFLEDQMRGYGEKVAGRTCIPTGLFQIDPVHDSPMALRYYERWDWFRGLPGLTWASPDPMVPVFDLLRVHPGNDHEDSRGCPLTATTVERVGGDYEARGSVVAFKGLCERLYAAWDRLEDTHLVISDHELRL